MRDPATDSGICQACGACCGTSREWPRFSTESDAELALIPAHLVDPAQGHMRCAGDRCSALAGRIGVETACTVYGVRPVVCRDCTIGDDACTIARVRFGLPPLG